MTTCIYCGKTWTAGLDRCQYCGAPAKTSQVKRYDPFRYDEYVVYELYEAWNGDLVYRFYKGMALIGDVRIRESEYDQWRRNEPQIDHFPAVVERLEKQIVEAR